MKLRLCFGELSLTIADVRLRNHSPATAVQLLFTPTTQGDAIERLLQFPRQHAHGSLFLVRVKNEEKGM